MDVLETFLHQVAYKFPKGYPDLKDKQDIILLESLFEEIGIPLILENQNLISIIKSSPLFKEYGDLEASGRDTIKLYFSDIPSRGDNSDTIRKEVYEKIKELVDNNDKLSNFSMGIGGSSLGHAKVDYGGKTYKLIVKGTSEDKQGDTDVKEALVSLFYSTNIDSPFDKDNYDSRIPSLIEISSRGIQGESSQASEKVKAYLEAIQEKAVAGNLHVLNQSLSPALALKQAYPGQQLIRTGLFDQIRSKAQQLTGFPADKWNPGDLYVYLGGIKNIDSIDNIELLNDLFVDEWGDNDKPLVSISLKQEKAQGGKAKTLLSKYTKVKDNYNLTRDEIQFNTQQYMEGIEDLRNQVQSLVRKNPNIEYKLESGELKDNLNFLRGKYAALKSIKFLFEQFTEDDVDDAMVALVGFGMSLTGVNPTFFKLKGQKSGEEAHISEFERGQNVSLYSTEHGYDPIQIIDKATFGGLEIDFTIEKGGKPFSIIINARSNGNTQGTLEIKQIKPL